MSNTLQGKLTKDLNYLGVLSIYYRLGNLFFCLVMPLFAYADLVWGGKDNVTLKLISSPYCALSRVCLRLLFCFM